MQFLQTGIYTFSNKSFKENFLTIKSLFGWGTISFILMTLMFDEGLMLFAS